MFETTSYASIRWDTVVREGGSLLDQFRQAADAILALPEIAEALMIHRAWQVDQMPDLSPERVGELIRGMNFGDPPTA